MAKVTLNNLTNLENEVSVVGAINANNDNLETALENTLSRDGTAPNEMNAILDMNNFRIINVHDPVGDHDVVTKATLASLASFGVTNHSLLTGLSNDDHPQYALKTQVREILTGNRTYYVRTDGNDANTGLVNTAGGAFATLQKAINTVAAIDISIYQVTIKLGTGTYSGAAANCYIFSNWLGTGSVVIEGDMTTPSNVVLQGTSGLGTICVVSGSVTVQGVSIGGSIGIAVRGAGNVTIGAKVRFLACSNYHLTVDGSGGVINGRQAYEIAGDAAFHIVAVGPCSLDIAAVQVTLTGTRNFAGSYVYCVRQGLVNYYSNTFVGTATGTRYIVDTGGGVFVNGAGTSYLPGSSAGSLTSPGWYS